MADISKKFLYFIAVLWGVTFISFSVYADDGILFRPEVLKINFLHFHLSYHDFMIEDSGEGTLNITKNTPDKEIRGGFIVFNNKIILLGDFFLGSDISFEKTVSLKSTTRMMIFLRGTPGASITLAVKKKNDAVPPEATFSAEPSTITAGETSTLAWSTTNAETVNIEPAIGNVSLNGTHSVSPTETTTYNLVASGPGGTTTKTAIVTVTIPNNPPAANQDEATTGMGKPVEINVLANDTDTDGDILTISAFSQPANGIVTLDTATGIFAYTPNAGFYGTDSFSYTVSDGNGGIDSATVSITVITPISLEITSPAEGVTLSTPFVIVKGTISNTTDVETGVVVNGIIANRYGNQFAANNVPLQEGQNTIAVTATDANGVTVSKSITMNAEISSSFIKLSAYPESGVASLETALQINGSFSIINPVISWNGPGTVEQLESDDPDEYKYRISTEGLYTFTATAIGPDNNTYVATISINVLSLVQIDSLLKTKWNGLTSALENSDIASALDYMLPSRRVDYEITFNLLKDQWPSIISSYSGFTILTIEGLHAKYELAASKNGKTYVYQIDFKKDPSGLWFINEF